MDKIIERLRSVANRCVRVNTDVALLCEAALSAADAMERGSEHVAWCRYITIHEGQTRIVLCDSDASGAFKVYRGNE